MGTVPVTLQISTPGRKEMKTNWEHQKKAITTDQKYRTDDEHMHEQDKQNLKESEVNSGTVPKPAEKTADKKV